MYYADVLHERELYTQSWKLVAAYGEILKGLLAHAKLTCLYFPISSKLSQ